MTKQGRFAVVGAGSWGTALAILLSNRCREVVLWGRKDGDRLASDRANQRYLPGIEFPENLQIALSSDALVAADLRFLVAVPSHAFRSTLHMIRDTIVKFDRDPADATILWGTKGFDPESGDLLSTVVEQEFPGIGGFGSISGPSFARETAIGLPTALTLAMNSAAQSAALAEYFRTSATRIYSSLDIVGVQAGGAVKNVLAIATGISDGLGYGANARAALITRGLAEMQRLGIALGGLAETFSGLTGVGDLILTCTDNQSRNRRFGLGIGAGNSRPAVVADIRQEIEGIQTTREVWRKAQELRIDMPITAQVYEVLYHQRAPADAVTSLLRREPRAE